jgi:cysteine synthase
VLDLVRHTSLVSLERIHSESSDVVVYAEAEWENPGGWVKDRTALVSALEMANQMASGVMVTILAASGGKYLTEGFWDERR